MISVCFFKQESVWKTIVHCFLSKMKKTVHHLLIFIKLLCLGTSVVFLIRWMSANTDISDHTMMKTFTINRESSSFSDQITTVENYLSSVTWEQIALAVYASGETSLILPATADYEIYRAYLQSIQPFAGAESVIRTPENAPPLSSSADISRNTYTTQKEFMFMILFLLLALFL